MGMRRRKKRRKKKNRSRSAVTWDEFRGKMRSLCEQEKPQLFRLSLGKPILERIKTDVHSDEPNDGTHSPQDEVWIDNDIMESERGSDLSTSVKPLRVKKKKKKKGRKKKKRSKSRSRRSSVSESSPRRSSVSAYNTRR